MSTTCIGCGRHDGHPIYCPHYEPSRDDALHELIAAAEQLLAWQPHCSRGSSGDLRQKRMRKAIDALTIVG